MRLKLALSSLLLLFALASAVAAQPAIEGAPPAIEGKTNRVLKMLGEAAVPNGLGVDVHFDAGHENDLELIASMGFRIIRHGMLWTKVEAKKGIYDWRAYDDLVANSRKRGLLPLLILAYSNPLYAPVWRGGNGRQDWAFEPPTTDSARDAFVAFARAAADRYKDQVIWEIWNEPNQTFGKPFRLEDYLRLARESCSAMRQAYPDAAIVGPASNGFAMEFLEAFIRNDTGGCFDAISIHPYRDWDPDSALKDWQRLDAAIARLDVGRRRIAIDSEWGYSVQQAPWTERRQADYVLRAYLTDLLAGIPVTVIYDFRNDGVDAREKEQNFGLFDFHGRPKPVAGALAGLVRELRGMRVLGTVHPSFAGVTAVAFGSPQGRLKIVAWSPSSTDVRLRIPSQLCVAPAQTQGRACGASGLSLEILPTSLRVSGKPAVAELQTLDCNVPKNSQGILADWCKAHRTASP